MATNNPNTPPATSRPEVLEAVSVLQRTINIDTSDADPAIGSKYKFPELRPFLEWANSYATDLIYSDLSRLSTAQIVRLTKSYGRWVEHASTLAGWDLLTSNPQARATHVEQCKELFGNLETATTTALALSHSPTLARELILQRVRSDTEAQHIAFTSQFSEYRENLDLTASRATELLKRLESQKADADGILAAIREDSGVAAAVRRSGTFEAEATRYGKAAIGWMVSTGLCSLLLISIALGSVLFAIGAWSPFGVALPTTGMSIAQSIQVIASKVFLFSTLSFAVVWCARNYRACRHNETVNRHRMNALLTFEALAKGAVAPETKDAVVLGVANGTFGPRSTGFDGAEEVSSNPIASSFSSASFESVVRAVTSTSK